MSITGKIRLGLGILLALLAAQFLISQALERATKERVDAAITKNFAAADALADIATQGQAIRRFEKEFFIYVNDDAGRAKYRKEWTTAFESLDKSLDAVIGNNKGEFSSADKALVGGWKLAAEFYGSEFKKVMERADAKSIVPRPVVVEESAKPTGKGAAPVQPVASAEPDLSKATKLANELIGPGKDRFRELLDGAQKLRKAKIVESGESVAAINKLFSNALYIGIGAFALAALVALYLMFSTPRAVTEPIAQFVGMADKISKGDVKQVIHAEGAIEFAGLAKALDRLRIAQSGLLERLRAKASV